MFRKIRKIKIQENKSSFNNLQDFFSLSVCASRSTVKVFHFNFCFDSLARRNRYAIYINDNFLLFFLFYRLNLFFFGSVFFSLSISRCVYTVKAMIIKLFKIALLSFFTCSLLMISIILNVYNSHYNIINDELLSFDNDERRDLFAFINQESHERKAL